jgi:hypothetical protein
MIRRLKFKDIYVQSKNKTTVKKQNLVNKQIVSKMLCPEVLFLETKSSSSSTVFGTHTTTSVKDTVITNNDVFDQLKFVIPGSLFPPDNLHQALNIDTEFYRADDFQFQLLVEEEFLKTFIEKGKLFLQTFVGPNTNENFLCILPSGKVSKLFIMPSEGQ